MSKIDPTDYPDTVAALDGSEQRATVFLDRYALKATTGKPKEYYPEDMWNRVAAAIASSADESSKFLHLLRDFKFVPGGRVLAGAGTGTDVTFYNCYVIPVETKAGRHIRYTGVPDEQMGWPEDKGCDSREAIIDTVGVMVDIMSRGGGVGINWSTLRPRNSYLKSINATSSGPIDWMHFASVAVGTVEQGGSRRGAAMFMLNDWHPDLMEFINAKREAGRITNANISVGVSDEFMKRVAEDKVWNFLFPDTSHPAYDAEWDGDLEKWNRNHGGEDGAIKLHGSMPAREVWRALTDAAHASGEPGIIFLDRYNKQSTAGDVETIICVNPCGEQGLGAYSVCNLGAMNLAAYILPEAGYSPSGKSFDWDAFKDDVRTAVRFMDRVIDVNKYFIPENEKAQKDLRRIGLGVMGLADALIALGVRYGSHDAVQFTEDVFRTMKDAAIEESIDLAGELGAAPAWDPSMWDRPYLAEYRTRTGKNYVAPLRNLFLLTQAPTGTTSILAGVNSGIEPLFDLGYWREDRTGKHWVEPSCLKGITDPAARNPDYVVTAADVTVEEHIAMQAAVQKYVDSSVSKTINAPEDQTADETAKAYQLAYDSGLKGLAYYRDKSRDVQVLNKVKEPKVEDWKALASYWQKKYDDDVEDTALPFVRDEVLAGKTRKVQSKYGSVYVTVNYDENAKPVEVFFSAGKSGEETMLMAEALGRLASLALRKGATLGGVANQLEGIGGQTNIAWSTSLPHAIGKALSAENKDDRAIYVKTTVSVNVATPDTMSHTLTGQVCPECSQDGVMLVEGCKKCRNCGWSAC